MISPNTPRWLQLTNRLTRVNGLRFVHYQTELQTVKFS